MSTSEKKSKGRQKVVMVRMAKDSNRQVTFSKRRLGLFKKASEICTLCGAEAAIVVYSPGQKAYSFGHPSVDAILDKYVTTNPPPEPNTGLDVDENQEAHVRELGLELTLVGHQMQMEKRRGEEISEIGRANTNNEYWWNAIPIEKFTLEQLEHFKGGLEMLKRNVIMEGNKLMMKLSGNNNGAIVPYGTNPMVGFEASHGYGQGY